jgi:hypothetical protein
VWENCFRVEGENTMALRVILVFVCLVASRPAFGADCIWTGAGADNKWSTTANWTGCGATGRPANGDDVSFPNGAARGVNENDLVDLRMHHITIRGTAAAQTHWSITGAAITLTSLIDVATRAFTTWGLAEGRLGGPLNFHTYILPANAEPSPAEVKVTYLRENGPPIVKTCVVPAKSRVTIDTSSVDGLANESFGAEIVATNGIPIVVERSLYWDTLGFLFSGGTNATGTPVP